MIAPLSPLPTISKPRPRNSAHIPRTPTDARRGEAPISTSLETAGAAAEESESVAARGRNASASSPVATTSFRSPAQPRPVDRQRPLRRSMRRRSRFVGRPAPRSRSANAISGGRSGDGGEWSMKHSTAIDAPTRLTITQATSTTRSRWAIRASTVSPTTTAVDGLAAFPLTLTWPARHTPAASARVLVNRTDHNH